MDWDWLVGWWMVLDEMPSGPGQNKKHFLHPVVGKRRVGVCSVNKRVYHVFVSGLCE